MVMNWALAVAAAEQRSNERRMYREGMG